MDFSKDIVRDFQTRANLMLAFISRISAGLMLIVMILNITKIFIMPPITYPVLSISILIMFLPTLYYNILHKDSMILRYVFLTMMVFMSGMLYAIFSYHTIIMLVFPIVLSCLYCRKENVIFVSILSVPVIIVSHLIAYYLKFVPDEPLITLHGVIFYGILPRVLEFLIIAAICLTMMSKIQHLIDQLTEKNNVLYSDQQTMIVSLSEMVEVQSQVTGQHVKRVAEYTKVLCEALHMSEEKAWKISTASMMHDIGKILISKEILDKPGKLTKEEFEVVKKHVDYGRDLLLNTKGELLEIASKIAYEHHERYDGNGYHGLKGEEISLAARIVAIVDVFDALMSWRPYKEAWNLQDARQEILNNSGTQFDPKLVKLFDENFDQFEEIYHNYQ